MKFYVGVTDNSWYHYLASLGRRPEEVNFWKPHTGTRLATIQPGELFLFKLKSPENAIAGGGFYLHYSILPLSMAWAAFEGRNGAESFPKFAALIRKHEPDAGPDYRIGCMVLNEPFFFERRDWIPTPPDFKLSNQQGRYYDTSGESGKRLWSRVEALLGARKGIVAESPGEYAPEIQSGYGAEYLARTRLGQGGFKTLLLDLYHRRCAITGEKTMPVLQAAHIRPFSEQGPNKPQNGLLLRADVHILFDKGYITVTPDLHVEVSKKIKEEYENGRDYYKYHGAQLVNLPQTELVRPSKEFLEWHNRQKYNG